MKKILLAIGAAALVGAVYADTTVTVTPGSGKVNVVRRSTDGAGDVTVLVDKCAKVNGGALPAGCAPAPTPAPTTTSADADFLARRSAAGVVRWFDFDSVVQLGNTTAAANFGAMAGSAKAPSIDTTVKASGAGALRFDITSQSGSNGAGSWYANFSPDLQTQFGENSEFYVQWRQRFSPEFVSTVYTMVGGGYGGIKQAIVGTGDKVIGDPLAYSCSHIDLVTTTYAQHREPTIYNTCIAYQGLYESVPPGPNDFRLQNGTAPYCLYTAPGATPAAVGPGCFGWVANEWMTFEIRVKTGPRKAACYGTGNTLSAGDCFDASELQLWGAREGGNPFLIVDWRPGIPGYFPLYAGKTADSERFGKVWLLPYQTSKDATIAYPLAQTWYDELIVSRQPISFPGGKTLTIPAH